MNSENNNTKNRLKSWNLPVEVLQDSSSKFNLHNLLYFYILFPDANQDSTAFLVSSEDCLEWLRITVDWSGDLFEY